jgi:hypothetical protein
MRFSNREDFAFFFAVFSLFHHKAPDDQRIHSRTEKRPHRIRRSTHNRLTPQIEGVMWRLTRAQAVPPQTSVRARLKARRVVE